MNLSNSLSAGVECGLFIQNDFKLLGDFISAVLFTQTVLRNVRKFCLLETSSNTEAHKSSLFAKAAI